MNTVNRNTDCLFTITDNDGNPLVYNCRNGNLAYGLDISDLDESFFKAPADTIIDVDRVNYEQLYLAVTESCNCRCLYCRQQKSSPVLNMTREEIKDAIDLFYKISACPRSIVFFGGEPFVNFTGIKFAVNYVREFDKDISFSMVTNGSLCTPEIAAFLADNDVEVIVSIDGPESLHNRARVFSNGRQTYTRAINGYHILRDAGCKVGITSVIGPHNEKHFDELIDWAIQLKPNTLGFCLPHGDETNFAMKLSSFEDVHRQMIQAYEVLHQNRIYLVQVEQKIKAFVTGFAVPYECKACGKRIVACSGGKYGNCEGPITNHVFFYSDIEQVTRAAQWYRKSSPFLNKLCENCIAYRICGGGCVYDKITRFGRVDVPDETRCGLNRLIAMESMKLIASHMEFIKPHILSDEERRNLMEWLTFPQRR